MGALAGVLAAAALLAGSASAPAAASTGSWLPPLKQRASLVWAVGDGADGGNESAQVGALLGSSRVDRFLYLGDVYETGTAQEFAGNYDPSLGMLADRTAPTLGNHESANRATGYLPYWEGKRGRAPAPWYAVKVSGWQIISLDSNSPHGQGSAQLAWLYRKLNRSKRFGSCRIAIMHHPRFSSSMHGDHPSLDPVWQALTQRAELVLAGHDHGYQRFDPVSGLTQFVVGTGGYDRYPIHPDERLASWDDSSAGALRIKLSGRKARASYVTVAGEVRDRSAFRCQR